jgi:hypothetical protein
MITIELPGYVLIGFKVSIIYLQELLQSGNW